VTKADDLMLYHYDSCPYCVRVRRALSRLGVEVELRNIDESEQHLEELVKARGRRTVPVLRIRKDGGDVWMPESADIVRYLEQRFGT
jgi:glutathione S-transferase